MAATPKDTQRYFEKHSLNVGPTLLGRTGWSVSPVGFGGYRVHSQSPENRAALELALKSGCNLIDTSSNYWGGGSERLIGEVIEKLANEGAVSRDEIVVVTKAGYVQGANLELAKQRKSEGKPFPEMVEYRPDCWHCISPEFLEDQITRSLERLKLKQVDALLLHNPEYFLKTSQDHREYYRRIRKAFEYLETEVTKGRIQYYGISSNSFPDANNSPEYTSLETVIELANELGPKNRFAIIQFPFNLLEPGAFLENNNTGGMTVCELAEKHELGVLINRPLNAFNRDRLVRLASFPEHKGRDLEKELNQTLNAALKLEAKFPKKAPAPQKQLAWGHVLKDNLGPLMDLETWKQALQRQIEPQLANGLKLMNESEDPTVKEWADAYRGAARRLLETYTEFLEQRFSAASKRIADEMDRACSSLKTSKTLSQKSIRVYRSVPGISSVLVGMRRPDYVKDALTLAPPISPEDALNAIEAVANMDE